MSSIFYGCQKLRFLNFSSFNTSLVKDMKSMFEGCNSLTSLNLTNFDTSLVTNMMSMFFGCRKLTSLNLSNFNIPNLLNIAQMFKGCSKLEYINLYNFTNGGITHMTDVFYGFLDNIIYCVNNISGSEEIIQLLDSKKCSVNDCSYNWKNNRKKIVAYRDICIDDCSYDEIYKYEYNDYCYEFCPKGSHSSKNNIYICENYKKECVGKYPFIFTNNRSCSEECNCNSFFRYICNSNKGNKLSQSYLISNISKGIQEGIINKLLEGVLNEKKDFIKKENDTIYQITSSFNQNNENSISFSDLNECEEELKAAYSI
jgi:surface protein